MGKYKDLPLLGTSEESHWSARAECHKRKDEVQELNKLLGYDMFYPETGKTGEAVRYAKRFCRSCPVIVECYTTGKFEAGIWGGETESTRRRQARMSGSFLLALQTRVQELWPDENKPHNEESNPDPESTQDQ